MKIYSAKYDFWLICAMTALLFVGLASGFDSLQHSPAIGFSLLGAICLAVLTVLVCGVPCEYYLDDHHLHIRSGLFTRSISYDDIQGVEPAAPHWPKIGWSLRRVNLLQKHQTIQISPERRHEFVAELQERIAMSEETTANDQTT